MRGGSCCKEKQRTGYAVMVKQLSCGLVCGVVCRGKRAVRRNGELYGGKKCDGMWVFPYSQIFFIKTKGCEHIYFFHMTYCMCSYIQQL
jgi:hypothetical protein